MFIRYFAFSAAAVALMAATPLAQAETVTTRTYVQAQDMPNINEVDFTVFDTNGDGFYSMHEVGTRLFKSFDKDGNGHIDNIEWDHKAVMTIVPMEKTTFKYIDSNDDGLAEKSVYTYETFYDASGLSLFDTNKNGLSASEFIGVGYRKLDRDDNNMIDQTEWEQAYLQSRPRLNDPDNYNN